MKLSSVICNILSSALSAAICGGWNCALPATQADDRAANIKKSSIKSPEYFCCIFPPLSPYFTAAYAGAGWGRQSLGIRKAGNLVIGLGVWTVTRAGFARADSVSGIKREIHFCYRKRARTFQLDRPKDVQCGTPFIYFL